MDDFTPDGKHWLIWDGECGMCSRFAARMRDRDPERKFHIVSRQACPSPPMTPEAQAQTARNMVVFTNDGKTLLGADAVLYALAKTGSPLAALAAKAPIIWAARPVYAIVARNRHHITRLLYKDLSCGLENRYPEVDTIPNKQQNQQSNT